MAELASRLAAQPRFALRATKEQVNALAEEMVGTGRNANDADSLVVALQDPESREAARRYLAGAPPVEALGARHGRGRPRRARRVGPGLRAQGPRW